MELSVLLRWLMCRLVPDEALRWPRPPTLFEHLVDIEVRAIDRDIRAAIDAEIDLLVIGTGEPKAMVGLLALFGDTEDLED